MKEDKLRDTLLEIKKNAFEVGFHSGWKAGGRYLARGRKDSEGRAQQFLEAYTGYAREEKEFFALREELRICRIFEDDIKARLGKVKVK